MDARQSKSSAVTLLATDQQRSVLQAQGRPRTVYTAYGFRASGSGLGFNGHLPEARTESYLLGNGYRTFNPVLMRFNSPDSWSPFGNGGLSCYAYCGGDPINNIDPSGHSFFSALARIFRTVFPKPVRSSLVPDEAPRLLPIKTSVLEAPYLRDPAAVKAARLMKKNYTGTSAEFTNSMMSIPVRRSAQGPGRWVPPTPEQYALGGRDTWVPDVSKVREPNVIN
ncbi:RHS repeat-associated core domain-containing protein [Pseudomonas sp. R5(2019)]|uniref:RHS repeat-associated core domain-containing protein n=1 Tax=Pseudomonas sp. R5(2019) TaxID=2697566 RepID=UPI00141243EF|nr:hypothetical protein [Pseudomonas sp. R5(2019)]